MTATDDTRRRVLVLGATGYIGSRLVPALLEAGHEVVASSSRTPDPSAYDWGDAVEWRRCDATDPAQVARAVEDVDALCYLVHSLDAAHFADRDRVAARTTAAAVAASGVRRVVYLSGLVPHASGQPLSDHLASRHEVEGLLAASGRSTLALRAGVVIGAGSTSFEIVRQLAMLLVVQPAPLWMRHRVQPVAVSDMVRALVEALEGEQPTGSLDVGGPDVLSYVDLMTMVGRTAGLLRLRVPVLVAPSTAVGLGMAALTAAPPRTALTLAHSLRDDMVCRPGRTWVPAAGAPLLGAETAVRRALAGDPDHAESARPGDARWTRRVPLVESVPSPASVRAAGVLAVRRLREGVEQARRLRDRADRTRPDA
ncbi:NAD(P)H-binding protein [Nocardioides sp. GXQ0305]|uniref:NAD(P)H-binding protein n=1 Tax=Nocardioides sp. GXQ0305 TaxID=3423912 RepID=UPI003D7E3DF5